MDIKTSIPTNHGDWAAKYAEQWKSDIAKLREKFGSTIESVQTPSDAMTDMPIVWFKKDAIVEVMTFVKKDLGYDFLSDMTATDESPDAPRFHLVLQVKSMSTLCRLRFKARVAENEDVPTLSQVWDGADWQEREIWDMFGIQFRGHPNLRRILMDQRWVGHPLRKDYPLRGYQIFPTPEPVDEDLLNRS